MIDYKKILIILISIFFISSIKTNYSGTISIRLNEPSSLSYTHSNYSNMVFFSLIYENFFYIKRSGEIFSNIFEYYNYDRSNKVLLLRLKDNLSFSDGKPITTQNVNVSFRLFLNTNIVAAKTLSRIIKKIRIEKNSFFIELIYDNPNIISLLTTPGLVLAAEKEQVFSGIFVPSNWEKGKHLILSPNPFYPGGRTYLDSVKVVFYDYFYPEVFLSNPNLKNTQYHEYNAGIYQNIYLSFPHEKIGQNTRIALYFLLRDYFKNQNLSGLNSLTSDEESPISINIKRFQSKKIRSILRNSRINLYAMSSLKGLLENFEQYHSERGIKLTTVYLNDNQIINFSNESSIKYILVEKMFNRKMSLQEKISKIIQEITFVRFNEKYLKLLNELKEFKYLNNEELLINQVTKIVENIIKDGFILPLCQKQYSLYIKEGILGVELDYYGRPLFQRARIGKKHEN